MIGKAAVGPTFGGLHRYLLEGGEAGSDRVEWLATRNLWIDDPGLAGEQMEATAAQNVRVEKPVYHLSLALHPDESLSREQWERAADRVLRDLGLSEHQVLVVAHNDQDHQHIHLMVNRVHPETHRTWDNKNDWRRIETSLRELERELGLRQVRGHHARSGGDRPPERSRSRSSAELHEAGRKGEAAWVDQVRERVRPLLQQAQGWRHLEDLLADRGLRLERRGQGLVVTDGERAVKASRVARGASAGQLAKRFGEGFDDWMSHRGEVEQAAEQLLVARSRGRGDGAGESFDDWRFSPVTGLHPSPKLRASFVVSDELEVFADRTAERRAAALPDYTEAAPIEQKVAYRHILAAARRGRHEVAAEVNRQLVELYGPDEVGRARRTLVRLGREEGWSAVAEELRKNPERFGRLDGQVARFFTAAAPLRHRAYFASAAAHYYALAREECHRVQRRPESERDRFLVNVRLRRLPAEYAEARRLASLARLPQPRRPLETIARFVARRGVRALQNALTPPAFRVVLAAVRSARLLSHAAQRQERSR